MIFHLCLGSNLDDPEKQLDRAISALRQDPEITILRASSRIRTAPYGRIAQPDFYNQVLEVESELEPEILMRRLLALEADLGRIRAEKWGPRIIDIDILLAQNRIVNIAAAENPASTPAVTIPHPDFQNRLFALQLLNELIPNALHPVMQKTINELYYMLRNRGGKK